MDVPFRFYDYFCYCQILKLLLMEISKENLNIALSKIATQGVKCPVCGCGQLAYEHNEVQNMMYDRKGANLVIDKISFKPVLSMTCSRCGYIMQFDLIHLVGQQNLL
jgi:predicted nucleic-acid-binding Zn-ribbon protein